MKGKGIRFISEHIGSEDIFTFIVQNLTISLILAVKWLRTIGSKRCVVFVRPGAIYPRLRIGNIIEEIGRTTWNLKYRRKNRIHNSSIGTGWLYRRDDVL